MMKKLLKNRWFYTALLSTACITTFAVGCDSAPETPSNTEQSTYAVEVQITPPNGYVMGLELPLYSFDAQDFGSMSATVMRNGSAPKSTAIGADGKVRMQLEKGRYTLTVKNGNVTAYKSILVENEAIVSTIPVNNDLRLGENVGNATSSNDGWIATENSVLLNEGLKHVLIGLDQEEMSDAYYFEAELELDQVGTFVGLVMAHEDGALLGGNGKALAFSYSGSNGIYFANDNTEGNFNTTPAYYANASDPANAKVALLRERNSYYVLIDDVCVGNYETSEYGKSGFGFISKSAQGTGIFSNIQYTVNADTVAQLKAKIDENGNLGGAFMRPDGSVVSSYNQRYTVNADGTSGVMKNYTYLLAGGQVGNVYYAEATFDRTPTEAWVGIMVNTLDGEPSANKGWLGYGIYNNDSLFLHENRTTWFDGTYKRAVNTGEGAWKLGVARVNNTYFVYLNDELILTESVSHFQTANNALALPADNYSGFGLFMGENGGIQGGQGTISATFKNFNYTMDLDKIAKKIGYANVTLGNVNGVVIKQAGMEIKNGGKLIAGVPVNVTVSNPNADYAMFLTKNGTALSLDGADGEFSFVPEANVSYDFSIEYGASLATLALNLVPKENKVGNTAYALYDMTVDKAQAQITVYNQNNGQTINKLYSELINGQMALPCGNYLISVKYNGNTYEHFVALQSGRETTLKGYVSPVRLEGSLPNSVGGYASFGGGTQLLDGSNDSVAVVSHTYSFNNQTAGTKYYVEGIFNSTLTYAFKGDFGGLLVSHGLNSLANAEGDAKFSAGIRGNSVVIVMNERAVGAWGSGDMRTVANFDSVLTSYDPTAVKLGVLRDGTKYWFFVNDVYVGYYVWETVTTASGFGVVCTTGACTQTIKKFNYSFNEQYLNALQASAPQTNKSIDIYLIAGQSNAAGFSTYNEQSLETVDDRLQYGVQNVWYAGNGEDGWATPEPHEFSWTLTRMGMGKSDWHIGPEAGMALSLSKYYNAQSGKIAGLIKFAHGGTSLLDEIGGQNEARGNWVSPSYEATISPKSPANKTGGMYRDFLAQVKKNIAELRTFGFTDINIKGMYWMQGEADRHSTAEYQKAFKYFVSDVRGALTSYMQRDCSQMAVYIGEISRSFVGTELIDYQVNEAFIAAQRELATMIPNVYIVNNCMYDINIRQNNTNVVVGTDQYHWNERDCLAIGRLVGNCILDESYRYTAKGITGIKANGDGSVNILSPASWDRSTYKYAVQNTQYTSFTADATFLYTDGGFSGGFAIKQGNDILYFWFISWNDNQYIVCDANSDSHATYYLAKVDGIIGAGGSFYHGTPIEARLVYSNGVAQMYIKQNGEYVAFSQPLSISNPDAGSIGGAHGLVPLNANAPVQVGVAFFGDGSGVGTVNNFKVSTND